MRLNLRTSWILSRLKSRTRHDGIAATEVNSHIDSSALLQSRIRCTDSNYSKINLPQTKQIIENNQSYCGSLADNESQSILLRSFASLFNIYNRASFILSWD